MNETALATKSTEEAKDAVETLYDYIEEARKLHGTDNEAAREWIMGQIKGQRPLVLAAAFTGINALLCRFQGNVQRALKDKPPVNVPGDCQRGYEAIAAAARSIKNWRVSGSGKLLMDATREDLENAEKIHGERENGEAQTRAFYAALKKRVPEGKIVKQCLKESEIEKLRDECFGR